jgi:hypothetical protein
LVLLNHALAQTNWPGGELSDGNWRGWVRKRLRQVNWAGIGEDVRPFVEPGFDLSILTLANLERVLGE